MIRDEMYNQKESMEQLITSLDRAIYEISGRFAESKDKEILRDSLISQADSQSQFYLGMLLGRIQRDPELSVKLMLLELPYWDAYFETLKKPINDGDKNIVVLDGILFNPQSLERYALLAEECIFTSLRNTDVVREWFFRSIDVPMEVIDVFDDIEHLRGRLTEMSDTLVKKNVDEIVVKEILRPSHEYVVIKQDEIHNRLNTFVPHTVSYHDARVAEIKNYCES